MKKNIVLLTVIFGLLLATISLTECKHETCADLIQNQGETGIDCGGNCEICATCLDGQKNQDETDVDCGGKYCPPCPSCTDGILNQDETSIDCGGVCGACVICVGNGQNNMFPLARNNTWRYTATDVLLLTNLTISTTEEFTYDAITYYKVKYNMAGLSTTEKLLRMNSAGDILEFRADVATEMNYIPKLPVPGEIIATYNNGYRKVDEINKLVITPTCTYTNCAKIDDYVNDTIVTSSYYFRGLGLVKQVSTTNPTFILESVTLH